MDSALGTRWGGLPKDAGWPRNYAAPARRFFPHHYQPYGPRTWEQTHLPLPPYAWGKARFIEAR